MPCDPITVDLAGCSIQTVGHSKPSAYGETEVLYGPRYKAIIEERTFTQHDFARGGSREEVTVAVPNATAYDFQVGDHIQITGVPSANRDYRIIEIRTNPEPTPATITAASETGIFDDVLEDVLPPPKPYTPETDEETLDLSGELT